MGAASLTDVSLLDSYQAEWRMLSEHRCNVLLEGAVTTTDAVLHLLQPLLGEPIQWHGPHEPLDLPSGQTRTLIVRDAAALGGDDQRRLLVWSRETGVGTQIISMTPRPLFALVAAGVFDAALYYRLNVMLLRVEASRPRGLSSDDAPVSGLSRDVSGAAFSDRNRRRRCAPRRSGPVALRRVN